MIVPDRVETQRTLTENIGSFIHSRNPPVNILAERERQYFGAAFAPVRKIAFT